MAMIILLFAGAAVYSNTLKSPFHFDDFSFILDNAAIRSPERLGELFRYWPSRFIGFFSFAANYRIHQFDVSGYHLVNIALHVINSFLVFWFVSLTFSTPALKGKETYRHRGIIGFFAAAIFLTHPVQTEALNYIFQRVTILAAFFYLASLCLFAKAMLSMGEGGRINKFYYSASLAAALAGMFAKENVVTLPLMILLYGLYFFKHGKASGWKYSLPFLLLLPVVPVTVVVAKPVIFADIERLLNAPLLSSSHYFWTQLNVLITYLRLFLLPVGLNLDYDYPIAQTFWGMPALASFLILSIIISGILAFRRHRFMSFAIFWFFLALLPESSLVPLADPIYEHRLYLPMVGLGIFAADALYYLCRCKKAWIAAVILSAAVCTYSILTYQRNRVWKNEIVLWSDAVNKSPGKARPYNNRGLAYLDRREYDKAIADFSRSIEVKPDYADGYYNRGLAYQNKGESGRAISDYNKAIAINPRYLKAHINRGQLFSANRERERALSDFKRAIEIAPFDAAGYFNLAYLYLSLGKKEEAAAVYEKLLEVDPTNAQARYNLEAIRGIRGKSRSGFLIPAAR